MERMTSQKKIVLNYLNNVRTHPSAEEIYIKVRKKLPHISLSTIYRILNNAKEKREVIEIPFKISHFDSNTSPHAHFMCKKCKKIYDIFEKIKIPSKKVEKLGKVINYQLCFYGVCKKCQKQKFS